MKQLKLFLRCSLAFLFEYLKSLLDIVLLQYDLICDDVSWCSRLNKVSDGVNNFDIGHGEIMEGTGTNNQVSPYHIVLIGYFILVVDVEKIP